MDARVVTTGLTATLGAFGLASIVGGTAMSLSGRGAGPAAFGQQSVAWGVVNTAIAGFGAWRSRRGAPDSHRLRTILLANAVLDVGYVTVGALIARQRITFGGRINPDAAVGHGTAVVVQGTGLLTLDLAAATLLSLPAGGRRDQVAAP